MADQEFSKIPDDFPRVPRTAAIAGAQPKILLTQYEGRYYEPGCSPPEIYERWVVCEDLAEQLSQKSTESKNGKRSHMTETEILGQYLERLLATGWVSKEEATWVIRRAAQLIGWPAID